MDGSANDFRDGVEEGEADLTVVKIDGTGHGGGATAQGQVDHGGGLDGCFGRGGAALLA